MISAKTGVDMTFLDNPRKELAENELEVSNQGLVNLGFNPTLLNEGLVDDIMAIAEKTKVDSTGRTSKLVHNGSVKGLPNYHHIQFGIFFFRLASPC